MKKILIIFLIAFSSFVNSQESKIEKATEKFDNYAFVEAIKTYENVANDGYKSIELYKKLGDSYFFSGKLESANKWYTELFNLGNDFEPEYYFRYSQTLKSVENYEKADHMFNIFLTKSNQDANEVKYISNKNYLEIIEKNSNRYTIENLNLNSNNQDYGTSFYGDKIVFSSSRINKKSKQIISKWTNMPFTDLYVIDTVAINDIEKLKLFDKNINSSFHEDSPIFDKELSTMYFTRNNHTNGKTRRNEKDIILLKLYKSVYINGSWSEEIELPFNSNEYSSAHPALSPNGKYLYFVSDMPGGIGNSDLYKVEILSDGNFGKPQMLEGINTKSRETFPFISDNNELYFSSDGHLGLGGLDVFVTKLDENGNPTKIINVGKPINSPMDDFAYIIDVKNKEGYFSSNRKGGKGNDDIYKFKEISKLDLQIMHELNGIVATEETNEIIPNSKVILFDVQFNKIDETISDENGAYTFNVEAGKKYYIRSEDSFHETREQSIKIPSITGKTKLDIFKAEKIKKVTQGTDLAKTFNIELIYFDLDGFDIRKESEVDLAKILAVLNEYPNLKIEIRSHTDSRQSKNYNLKLSNLRAKSTIDWLIKNGIESSRLSGKGYGESILLNNCKDGVECSEDEHQKNRRSEFIITKL